MVNEKGEEVGIIYGWYCTITDKWYIGQTVNPEERFNKHIYLLKKDNTHFHNALRKYGLNNFVYCILEDNVLRENLNLKEIEWIEYYDSFLNGYNLTIGGDGINGVIQSKDTRKRISESLKGKPTWNKGKHLSENHKKKISESNKGKPSWSKGKHGIFSEETLKKISESSKSRHGYWAGKLGPNRRKVSKYDLNGNYIQTYITIREAVKENPKSGSSNIGAVCKGLRKQAGGFIWKYA